MHPRAAFRISLAAGLLVLLVTLLLSVQSAGIPCGNLAKNYAPIVAFELARSPADLEAIFGNESAPAQCRVAMIERMDAVNLVDVLVYIPVYAVFMAFFFVGMRARETALGTLGVRVSIIAALGDFAENACLMNLTPQIDPASVWFAILPWATGIKWLGLGVAAAIAALIYWRSTGARALNITAGLICAVAFLIAAAAIASPPNFGPLLGLGIGLSWIIYLITDAAAAFRAAAAPAELPRAG